MHANEMSKIKNIMKNCEKYFCGRCRNMRYLKSINTESFMKTTNVNLMRVLQEKSRDQ